MTQFDAALNEHLSLIRDHGLYRELRRVDSPQSPRIEIDGRTFLNFSSNDYLGLANEPAIKEAAIKAIEQFGAGAGASRLICGSLAPHHHLEETLAAFKGTEAALSFSSGYAAAIGTICALVRKSDIIVIDDLVHASIVDAARLCGAKLRVFNHNNLNKLEDILKWARSNQSSESAANTSGGFGLLAPLVQPAKQILIVTESVFSMDGDNAPLREIVELKDKYGAWLMVDEAHATGLYGEARRGLAEEFRVSDQIEVQMGTLGKALGASGGYICGSRVLIDLLINRARSFVFSTAPVPATAAAATAAIRFVQSESGQVRKDLLWKRVEDLRSSFGIPGAQFRSAIIPVMIGDEIKAVETANLLRDQGLFVPAIRYPTVAHGQARLRVTVTASHEQGDLMKLASAIQQPANRKS